MSPVHCLITGANGFIGQRLCVLLKQQNIQVSSIVRHSSKTYQRDHEYICDLAKDPIDPGWFEGVDTVFHLAGKTHAVSELNDNDSDYYQTNVEGTRNLLEVAGQSDVRRFIFFSSIKVMGEGGEQLLDETAPTKPESVYGKTKLEAERLVLDGNYIECPCVLRLPLVYGNHPKGNLKSMIRAIKAGKFPPVPAIDNKRSMVHIEDVVHAASLLATHPDACNEIFLLTDGKYYSTRKLYELISSSIGRRVPNWVLPIWFFYVIAKLGDVIGKARGRRFVFDSTSLDKLFGSAWYDSSKIANKLGFVAKHDLETTIPEIVKSMTDDK